MEKEGSTTDRERTVEEQPSGAPPSAGVTIGNPTPVLVFTFTLIVIMIWATTSGVFGEPNPAAFLVLGLSQLACFPVYLAGSRMLMEAGESFMGNLFLAFTTCFGGICGLSNIAVGVCGFMGIALNPVLNNFPLLWAGVTLVAATIVIRYADIPTFLAFACGAWMLITTPLMGLGIIPPVLVGVNGVVSLVIAACGLFTVFADLCSMGGVHVPKGPSFFHPRKKA